MFRAWNYTAPLEELMIERTLVASMIAGAIFDVALVAFVAAALK